MTRITPPTRGGFATRVIGQDVTYFEIDSDATGRRYAISVARPAGYAAAEAPLPVAYALDGQSHGSLIEHLHRRLTSTEAVRGVPPFVQVTIGYPFEVGREASVLRYLDFLPAGEPMNPAMPDYIRQHIRAGEGVAGDAISERFLESSSKGTADRFLRFIEQELHPAVASAHRVSSGDAGLFGFSYGGAFALFALTADSTLFSRYGASSPGMLVPDSQIFALYREFAERNSSSSRERHLHLTVADLEMFGPIQIYRDLGTQITRFYDLLCSLPTPGLTTTTEVTIGVDHESGAGAAYVSFVRACFGP
ncbi:alpha/beta hydrolase [Nocardioides sp.]|uniref:alpha/beta hydrolase n=1 Tax=Nocardioides sp. TaxID=35761 RepID=UPI0039E3CF3D